MSLQDMSIELRDKFHNTYENTEITHYFRWCYVDFYKETGCFQFIETFSPEELIKTMGVFDLHYYFKDVIIAKNKNGIIVSKSKVDSYYLKAKERVLLTEINPLYNIIVSDKRDFVIKAMYVEQNIFKRIWYKNWAVAMYLINKRDFWGDDFFKPEIKTAITKCNEYINVAFDIKPFRSEEK